MDLYLQEGRKKYLIDLVEESDIVQIVEQVGGAQGFFSF